MLPLNVTVILPCVHFRDTIELCKRAEHAHISWIIVHGRTVKQRAEPVNNEVVKMVRNFYETTCSISLPPGKRECVNSSGGQWRYKEFTRC